MFDASFILEIPNDNNQYDTLNSLMVDQQIQIIESLFDELPGSYQFRTTFKTLYFIQNIILLLQSLFEKIGETGETLELYKKFINVAQTYMDFANSEEGPFILPDQYINDKIICFPDDLPNALEYSLSKITKKLITDLPQNFKDDLIDINDRYFD